MFNKLIKFSKNSSLDFILKLSLSVAMVCIISPYSWEISPEYDVKFGSLMICLSATIFGWRIGGLTALLYLVAGAAGLPVFAGHLGGMNYFVSDLGYHPSTGYLFGYLMAALVVGFLAEKPTPEGKETKPTEALKVALLFIIGHIIIISLGLFHLYRIPDFNLKVLEELKDFIPSFLVKMGIFVVVVSLLGRKIGERD